MTKIKRKHQSKRFSTGLVALSLIGALSIFFVALAATHYHPGKEKDMDISPTLRNIDSREQFKNTSPRKRLEQIKRSEVHLIGIDLSSNPFEHASGKKTYSVKGRFCQLDWDKHKSDPAGVPMFKDLIHASPKCQRTTFDYDLWQSVQEAKAYDANNETNTHAMSPKGLVFHESRCGSTLVANSLAAFDPDTTRVYSESGPPIDAAKAYSSAYQTQSVQLMQDVLYMMGRTSNPLEENLFFKIQSIGVKSMKFFREAFPDVPFAFVYRDPVQVMMSHLKTRGTTRAVCLRQWKRPARDTKDLVKKTEGFKDVSINSLSSEEFCAAHLATLCQVAIDQIKDSKGKGKLINYSDLPNVLIDSIIPKHFGVGSLSEEAKENILKVNEKYSKGRNTGKVWEEDNTMKEAKAWEGLKDASKKFMKPVYEEMERLRVKEHDTIFPIAR